MVWDDGNHPQRELGARIISELWIGSRSSRAGRGDFPGCRLQAGDELPCCRHDLSKQALVRPMAGEVEADLSSRRFHPSVPHHKLLSALERLFKDHKLLKLFERIVHSHQDSPGKGLSIGSLTNFKKAVSHPASGNNAAQPCWPL